MTTNQQPGDLVDKGVQTLETVKRSYGAWLDSNLQKLLSIVDTFRTQRIDYMAMLTHLTPDYPVGDGRVFLGLRRAPAAKYHHHAREGGLVQHMLEMWHLWVLIKGRYEPLSESPCLSDELVMKSILNHDLHKAFCTYVLVSEDPWKADYMPMTDKDRLDKLLPQDMKSLSILSDHGIALSPELISALVWSEGGWSTAAKIGDRVERPPLAVLAYLLDEFSGNVLDRLRTKNYVS